jgi:hypothetical protein
MLRFAAEVARMSPWTKSFDDRDYFMPPKRRHVSDLLIEAIPTDIARWEYKETSRFVVNLTTDRPLTPE